MMMKVCDLEGFYFECVFQIFFVMLYCIDWSVELEKEFWMWIFI